jgi:hypothetical protein
MSSDQADGVKGRFTVVGGPQGKSAARFTVRVDMRERGGNLDPDDAWLLQAARRRRLMLGLVAVALTIALVFIWVL